MEKTKVSQDTLYKYLKAHGVKMIRLSEMMGVNNDVVSSCFRHRNDRTGVPRWFTDKSIALINEVLPRLADEIEARKLKYGRDIRTNQHGRTYDYGQLEPIKELGHYLNITALATRVLGWSKCKKALVLANKDSTTYGNISESDVTAINEEILSIAGVLSKYEVLPNINSTNLNA